MEPVTLVIHAPVIEYGLFPASVIYSVALPIAVSFNVLELDVPINNTLTLAGSENSSSSR